MSIAMGVIACPESNLEALRAALDDLARQGIDQVVCLGNVVGLGPDPDPCIDLVRERCRWTVCGRYDRFVRTGDLFGSTATFSNVVHVWTRERLLPGPDAPAAQRERWEWLCGLPDRLDSPGLTLAHGSAADPLDWILPRSIEADLARAANALRAGGKLQCVAGAGDLALSEGDPPSWRLVGPGDELALGPGPALLLPGWVGRLTLEERSRRLRHELARYATVVDGRVRWHAVPYDRDAFEAKARAMRLPPDPEARVLGVK